MDDLDDLIAFLDDKRPPVCGGGGAVKWDPWGCP